MSNIEQEEGIKKIEEAMINGLLNYLKTGDFPNNSPNSYMIAYSQVHKLADDENNSSEKLFNYYNDTIKNYIDSAYKRIKTLPNDKLLDEFILENKKCNQLIYWMKRIFTYLDKFYTKNKQKGTLCTNGLKNYREIMFIPLKDKLYSIVNNLIKNDRNCNISFRYKIKALLKIIEEVDYNEPNIIKEKDNLKWEGTNKNHFIDEWFNFFKQATVNYIRDKAMEDIQSKSAPEYIKSCLKYLLEEEERKNEYILNNYYKQIDDINNEYLIEKNAKTLAEKETGFSFMFKNKKDDEIKEAYELLSRSPNALKIISENFDPYIRSRGDELYKNKDLSKDPIKFIPELIKLKKEMDDLVEKCFDNSMLFQNTKNNAFAFFMSKELYSKQLANYVDYMMKIGIKSFNEQQIENVLNDVINLFKCLNNKLIFSTEANKKMSDRLIAGKTISLVAEKNFIAKLRTEAGAQYFTKMTGMINDLENSKTEIDLYKNQPHKGQPHGIKFNTKVVSQSAWEISTNKMDKIEINPVIEDCLKDFNDFYTKRHKDHKLLWCYGLTNVEIKYNGYNKNYLSNSTLCQYCILDLLQKNKELSIKQISEMLGYREAAVINDISGLVYNISFNKQRAKNKGVIIGDFGDEFKPENKVKINDDFVCNNLKFNTLPMVSKKKVQNKENELEEATILKRYQDNILQSTITRIMKSRINVKTPHNWLINETAKQIEIFKAQPMQIKDNIEKLIEKQIIKRNEKDRNCYDYIA